MKCRYGYESATVALLGGEVIIVNDCRSVLASARVLCRPGHLHLRDSQTIGGRLGFYWRCLWLNEWLPRGQPLVACPLPQLLGDYICNGGRFETYLGRHSTSIIAIN